METRRHARARRRTAAQRLTWIRAVHEELTGAYGSLRMVRELRGRGVPASTERVERLMREHGIQARPQRRAMDKAIRGQVAVQAIVESVGELGKK